MIEIFWEKTKLIDIGDGFTALLHEYPASDKEGYVLKAYIYYGTNGDDPALLTSIYSKNRDESYLYSQAFRLLGNKNHCRKVWDKHMYKKKQDEE